MHQQLPFKRTDRVGQQIKSILGDIALKYISLDHIGFVTFTSVNISNDLRNATPTSPGHNNWYSGMWYRDEEGTTKDPYLQYSPPAENNSIFLGTDF